MAPYSREIGDLLTSHGDWSGTPLAAQWLVPVALAAALVALFRRGQAHVYPALVAALSVELVCRVLWLAHFAGPSMRREVVWFPMFTAIAQFAVRMGVAFEALIISRFDVSRETRARAAGIAIIGGAVLASLCDRLLPDQLVYLWRQYAYLEVTVAMWAAEIWRVVRPVLECRRRRYRLCVAVWFSVLSVSASFVSGGLVCRMIRCSAAVWSVADIATHLALAAVVAATGLALTWGHAPRKRAAKAMAVVQMPAVRAA